MELTGKSLIASLPGSEGKTFRAFEPASGAPLEPAYHSASTADVEAAAQKAVEAFAHFGRTSGVARAAFLNQIAANIDALAEALIERAHQESALPKPRLKSEVGRTSGQLRLFAKVIQEGSWAMPCIDRPDPARKPPKPDLRSCLRPIGPVVIFGASNFPLAFSVAGGKLLAPKITTGPIGRRQERRSGLGGLRAGSGRSMHGMAHEPSWTTLAKSRSWPEVRPTSDFKRGLGRADSWWPRSIKGSARASMFAAL